MHHDITNMLSLSPTPNRDGALSMDTAMRVIKFPSRDAKFDLYERYLRWVLLTHSQKGNPDFDVRGEPKSYVDGRIFDGPWGRNQNDGPALRASVLIDYANELIAEGKTEYVLSKIYNPDPSVKSGIKYDLEYVANNWHEKTFEPWEEVNGNHFFVAMVQRKALIKGSELAKTLKDYDASVFFGAQAAAINVYLDSFYEPCINNITPSKNYGDSKVAKDKDDMDISTVLGALYGGMEGQSFDAYDERILASLINIEGWFQNEYPINWRDDKVVPGILFGRYPRDVYDGTGVSIGNPWILTTAAASEIYYLNAHKLKALADANASLTISSRAKTFYVASTHYMPDSAAMYKFLGQLSELADQTCNRTTLVTQLKAGLSDTITINGDVLQNIASALYIKADGFNERLNHHTPPDDSLAEQIDRELGNHRGAQHLTWSYANVLSAMHARGDKL